MVFASAALYMDLAAISSSSRNSNDINNSSASGRHSNSGSSTSSTIGMAMSSSKVKALETPAHSHHESIYCNDDNSNPNTSAQNHNSGNSTAEGLVSSSATATTTTTTATTRTTTPTAPLEIMDDNKDKQRATSLIQPQQKSTRNALETVMITGKQTSSSTATATQLSSLAEAAKATVSSPAWSSSSSSPSSLFASLAAAVDYVPTPLLAVDCQGCCIVWSRGMTALTNVAAANAIGHPFTNWLVLEEQQDDWNAAFKTVTATTNATYVNSSTTYQQQQVNNISSDNTSNVRQAACTVSLCDANGDMACHVRIVLTTYFGGNSNNDDDDDPPTIIGAVGAVEVLTTRPSLLSLSSSSLATTTGTCEEPYLIQQEQQTQIASKQEEQPRQHQEPLLVNKVTTRDQPTHMDRAEQQEHQQISLNLSTTALPVCVVDSWTGRIRQWNEPMAHLTGYTAPSVYNQPIAQVLLQHQLYQHDDPNNSYASAASHSENALALAALYYRGHGNTRNNDETTQTIRAQHRDGTLLDLSITSCRLQPTVGQSWAQQQEQHWLPTAPGAANHTATTTISDPLTSSRSTTRISEDIALVVYNVTAAPSNNTNNDIVASRGLVNDHQHQQEQQQDKEELLLFLQETDLPVLGIDANYNINYWNDTMVQLSGKTAQQVRGQGIFATLTRQWSSSSLIIGQEQQVHLQRLLERAIQEGKGSSNVEVEVCYESHDDSNKKVRDKHFWLMHIEPRYEYSRCHDNEVYASTNHRSDVQLQREQQEQRGGRQDQQQKSRQVVGALVIAQDVTAAAQHYRAVADMALELQYTINTAELAVFGIDQFGHINEWNEKMAQLSGYTADQAYNRSFVQHFVPVSKQQSMQELIRTALVEGRSTSNYELELCVRDNAQVEGSIRCFLVAATPRRRFGPYNNSNNIQKSNNAETHNPIQGVLFLAHDVTEATKHDRAVAAVASELRRLIDTANAPIFGIDREGDVNEWNDKTAELTGYTKDEAFDCNFVEAFVARPMQESVRMVLQNALEGRGSSNFEITVVTKFNQARHLLVNATTRRDDANNVVGVLIVAQDITESVQRDGAVAGMALELRQLIETANAPIFGIDIDGNVNEWNRRTHEITGYSKEEAFDEPLVERFIAPALRQRVKEILNAALQGNETSNYELEFITKSGERRFMLVNATTRRDPDFNIVGVLGVAQDVTADRLKTEELQKMQNMRAMQEAKVETERNMTAYFAHELRNPLSAVDSALSAMPDDLPPNVSALVSGMRLCVSFMSSIMNNLLDVRKIEEGMMSLNKCPLSLRSLVESVHKMLAPSVKQGVEFRSEYETLGRDWVLGDKHRIQQVLTNVVTNAIKYTMKGSITLYVGWEGDMVRLECRDTGPGIPVKEQERLFQRFVQRGGAPGTGLGLAIAKNLVDLTGGSIRFHSDPSVRSGTSCIVLMPLPACDPPEASFVEEKGTRIDKIEERLSFLIIDDIKMNRKMLRLRIEKGIAPNCVIQEAATGEEALEICGSQAFDVIVVDQFMEEAGGVMVGTDVVYAMRRMRIDSLIIGCSGNDLETEFKEAGADWVWQKPMPSNERIIEHLRKSLTKKGKLPKHSI